MVYISSLLQVAGVVLLEENKHTQCEEDFGRDPQHPAPTPLPFILPCQTVRVQVRERGKEEDDVPSAASVLLRLHPACDGHSTVLCSPWVTTHLILFLCLLWPPVQLVQSFSYRSPPFSFHSVLFVLHCECPNWPELHWNICEWTRCQLETIRHTVVWQSL